MFEFPYGWVSIWGKNLTKHPKNVTNQNEATVRGDGCDVWRFDEIIFRQIGGIGEEYGI